MALNFCFTSANLQASPAPKCLLLPNPVSVHFPSLFLFDSQNSMLWTHGIFLFCFQYFQSGFLFLGGLVDVDCALSLQGSYPVITFSSVQSLTTLSCIVSSGTNSVNLNYSFLYLHVNWTWHFLCSLLCGWHRPWLIYFVSFKISIVLRMYE